MDIDQYLLYIFVITVLINLFAMLMFLGRVHWPQLGPQPAGLFGILALVMGIPALMMVIVGIKHQFSFSFWLMPLLYTIFCVISLFLDIIWKIEFRQPRRLEILIPFLLLFFLSVIGMWGMLWNLGFLYWGITGVMYFLMLGSSIYASRKGVG